MTITFCNRSPVFSSVFIDFDGTIADKDVTDTLLTRFAAQQWQQLEDDWLAGKIGARECMERQIALLEVGPGALNACLDEMQIDKAFPDFIQLLAKNSIDVAIVSDGLDYGIRHILQRYGLSNIKTFANHLVYKGEDHWQLKFPYKNSCCPSGHCKCQRYEALAPGLTLYIGDGTSDFCPAEKADLVLAKGKLADYCAIKEINHVRVDNFNDIIVLWDELQYLPRPRRKVAS